MPPVIHKVYAYVTRGNNLLVFRHIDVPEAGIQVPGGTVKDGEDLADAALREAQEETGLKDLSVHAYLGEQIRDMSDVGRDEIHHRHFYQLLCEGEPPETWQHDETDPSDGTPHPIPLEFFWTQIPSGLTELICDQGILLPVLIMGLSK